jgi:methyl-accepting chemotaxis protein
VKIGLKLNLFVIGVLILVVSGLSVIFIGQIKTYARQEQKNFRRQALAAEKARLENLVHVAHDAVRRLYRSEIGAVGDDPVRRKALEKRLQDLIKALRYGPEGKDYFWINDLHPRMVMHPYKPALNGRDLSDYKDPAGKRLFVEFVRVCLARGGGFVTYKWPKYGSDRPVPKLSYVRIFKPLGWIIGTGVYIDRIDRVVAAMAENAAGRIRSAIVLVVALALVLMVLAALASLWFSRSLTRPLKEIAAVSEAMAAGDFSRTVTYRSRDEIGQMAGALSRSLDIIVKGLGEARSIKDGIPDPFFVTDNDLTVIYVNEACDRLLGGTAGTAVGQAKCHQIFQSDSCQTEACILKRAIKDDVVITGAKTALHLDGRAVPVSISANAVKDLDGNVIGGIEFIRDISADEEAQQRIAEQQADLLEVAGEVTGLADQLSTAAAQISATTEEMSANAEHQSAHTTGVAASMEQMSANIQQASQAAQRGAAEAQEAGQVARQGGEVVERTITMINGIHHQAAGAAEAVRTLAGRSREISDVVILIEDLADQTNLLALNAAIEAARVGEAGRGFAVVADEVKKLAVKTTQANQQVAAFVKAIQESTESTVRGMTDIQARVQEGVELVGRAGDILGKIVGSATSVSGVIGQIASAVEEQSAATEDISQNMGGIAGSVQEAASAVSQTAQSALDLSTMASRLVDTVARFNGQGRRA